MARGNKRVAFMSVAFAETSWRSVSGDDIEIARRSAKASAANIIRSANAIEQPRAA